MSRPILTDAQLREVARRYDGRTETIDALVKKFGCRRYNVHCAAQRLGVARSGERIEWTEENNQYLRDNYGLVHVDDLCEELGCSRTAILMQKRRLRISTRILSRELGYNVRELEELTRFDHRIINRFIDAGELRVTPIWVHEDEPWMQVVSIEDLHRFLRRRPEAINYRAMPLRVRIALELDRLPDPPRYKRLTCRSRAFDRNREHNDSIRKRSDNGTTTGLPSCADKPFSFWIPTYDMTPSCPRCGCKVTAYSEKQQYRDDEPNEGELVRMLASKLGLGYRRGRIVTRAGRPVDDQELIRYAFNSGRNPHVAFQVFAKLLQTGLSPVRPRPAARSRILRPLMDYGLRPRQRRSWERFLRESNIGIYWPPGEGKMFFGAWVASRIRGHHLILCNTSTLRDQWGEFFAEHCRYGADVVYQKSPHGRLVRIYDDAGDVRCTIELLTYSNRSDLGAGDGYQLVIFDEAHYLPGNRAHRFALVTARYRIGMTATAYREDGRADLLELLIGEADRVSWSEALDGGERPRPPIRVCVVEDQAAKLREASRRISRRRRGLVFVERLAEGRKLKAMTGFPFISGETKKRMQVLRDHPRVIMSRVGDHGLDLQDLQYVVEFGFFRGSRMQQLQRYGRLLHSLRRSHYLILMTREEFSRHYKRLSALEEQGLQFRIEVAQPDTAGRTRTRSPRTSAGLRDLLEMVQMRDAA